ncbi:hypothetical protein [Rhizobium sp. PP-CC-3G-465]
MTDFEKTSKKIAIPVSYRMRASVIGTASFRTAFGSYRLQVSTVNPQLG